MPNIPVLTLPGIDASGNNLGKFSLEPDLSLPSSDLKILMLYGETLESSMQNRASEGWDVGYTGPELTVAAAHITNGSGIEPVNGCIYSLGNPQASWSTIQVYYREPGDIYRGLGGRVNFTGESAGAGLFVTSSSKLAVATRKDGVTEPLVVDDPEEEGRWEMAIGVFDQALGQVTGYVPRKGVAVSQPAEIVEQPANFWVLGGVGGYGGRPIKSAMSAIYDRAISAAEVNEIYAHVKNVMSYRGIDI